MEWLSKWWLSEYAEEIASALQKREVQRMPFYFQSPQLQYRSHLVNWMRKVSEEMRMSSTCVHLAVYMLDIFMDNHAIVVERLNLVTLVCLLLAAKFEERDTNVPKITELNSLVENQYPLTDFISMEFMIMQFLKWTLVIPTPAHFAEYYVVFAIVPSDVQNISNVESYHHLQDLAQKYVKDFLDQTLLDPNMLRFRPSLVAASCIAAARRGLCLPKMWSPTLCHVTQYKLHDLHGCLEILFREERCSTRSHKRKIFDSPDHGYATDSSAFSSPDVASNKRK